MECYAPCKETTSTPHSLTATTASSTEFTCTNMSVRFPSLLDFSAVASSCALTTSIHFLRSLPKESQIARTRESRAACRKGLDGLVPCDCWEWEAEASWASIDQPRNPAPMGRVGGIWGEEGELVMEKASRAMLSCSFHCAILCPGTGIVCVSEVSRAKSRVTCPLGELEK